MAFQDHLPTDYYDVQIRNTANCAPYFPSNQDCTVEEQPQYDLNTYKDITIGNIVGLYERECALREDAERMHRQQRAEELLKRSELLKEIRALKEENEIFRKGHNNAIAASQLHAGIIADLTDTIQAQALKIAELLQEKDKLRNGKLPQTAEEWLPFIAAIEQARILYGRCR